MTRMTDLLALRGARKLVNLCAGIDARDEVVIVTDFATTDVAQVVAAAALEQTEHVNLAIMPPRKIDGEEPPAPVAAAMSAASVVFTPVQQSITHTLATKRALASGARGIMLTAYNLSMLSRGGIDADFEALLPLCRRVGQILDDAGDVHLTTPAGTDLRLSLRGRSGNVHPAIVRRSGELTTVPNAECSASPVEGTTDGVIVCDASVPYYGIGLVSEPIRFEVKRGMVVKISGGRQADMLSQLLASQGDPAVYNIAQISFGLNPRCPMEGVMLHDEGVYGTCHIGIGTSVLLGGVVKTLTHFDALMWKPTWTVDGEIVLKAGDWLVPEADVVRQGRV